MSDLLIEETDYQVKGHRLHARWLRQPLPLADRRPVLVFLHEALGSIAMWKDVPEVLATACGCHVLIYDRVGHGASAPLPVEMARHDYLYREAWEFLPSLLAAAGINRTVLIGHSDGGTIALLAAAKFPEQIKGVVAEAAHVLVEACTLQGIRDTIGSPELPELKKRIGRYHQLDIEPMFNRWPDIWLAESFAEWSMERFLPEIRCPLLVIQGEQDQFGSVRQVESMLENAGGHAEALLIPECGHVPHFQAREQYLQRIRRFLWQQGLIVD